ncbi:MAG: DUF456 domain-containing protein [Bacteroidales bacterium]|jgi:uncharacterized protein|nr:DUF456 domain-containing protein [Bacteroidales bacterium]MDD2205082.1 DUF456 domain-containing protein [Bacteroidales bacterium]MDD3914564.1 DUF456 domain-containing protein [Bacteroidales bacterium]MDD4634491.1 DUF456 domain-containing protein [Bacteroidales bacterium]
MDIFLYIFGGVLILIGLCGCILPILPGPPISFIGLLLLQLSSKHPFTSKYMWLLAVIVVVVTIIDNVIPIFGTKKLGGTKWGTWGATIGLIIGFFFAPYGIIIGPFAGAVIGELLYGKDSKVAFKSGIGSLIGFVCGTGLKLMTSGWITYEFFKALF